MKIILISLIGLSLFGSNFNYEKENLKKELKAIEKCVKFAKNKTELNICELAMKKKCQDLQKRDLNYYIIGEVY
jgi:hypothetical protein